jgi:UDP-N-acetylglucosamine enolpyruvyl transferase
MTSIRIAVASVLAAAAVAGGAVSLQHAAPSHVRAAGVVHLSDGFVTCCDDSGIYN